MEGQERPFRYVQAPMVGTNRSGLPLDLRASHMRERGLSSARRAIAGAACLP
jgi:hypothetical protein